MTTVSPNRIMSYKLFFKQPKSRREVILCRKLDQNPYLTNAPDRSPFHSSFGKYSYVLFPSVYI